MSRTAVKDNRHFATIFVILPLFADSADIRVFAKHGTVVSDVQLPKDLSQSASAIGLYAGVSDARIEVGTGGEVICLSYYACVAPSVVPSVNYLSGGLPPVRDGFCLWRHALNSGADAPALMLFFLEGDPLSARHFEGDDGTFLCHLAPLAKAYGFKMYIAELVHIKLTKQEIEHPYKEYDFDFDLSVLDMPDDADVEYEWNHLRTLDDVPVMQPELLDRATRMLKTDLQDELMEVDVEEDHLFVDDSVRNCI